MVAFHDGRVVLSGDGPNCWAVLEIGPRHVVTEAAADGRNCWRVPD